MRRLEYYININSHINTSKSIVRDFFLLLITVVYLLVFFMQKYEVISVSATRLFSGGELVQHYAQREYTANQIAGKALFRGRIQLIISFTRRSLSFYILFRCLWGKHTKHPRYAVLKLPNAIGMTFSERHANVSDRVRIDTVLDRIWGIFQNGTGMKSSRSLLVLHYNTYLVKYFTFDLWKKIDRRGDPQNKEKERTIQQQCTNSVENHDSSRSYSSPL